METMRVRGSYDVSGVLLEDEIVEISVDGWSQTDFQGGGLILELDQSNEVREGDLLPLFMIINGTVHSHY